MTLICNVKRSLFNGYVNKLKATFGNLQSSILMNICKSYCCSFYGSHLLKYCTNAFDKCRKACNSVIRNLLHLLYTANTWPLIDQSHIRDKLYHRNFICPLKANISSINIVRTCINAAMYNSNACIGCFYRYNYILCLSNTSCINCSRNYNFKNLSLSNNQLACKRIKNVIAIKSGEQYVNELSLNNVNYLMHTLSID